MSQTLPPQSDFPITLAEALCAELAEQRPDEAGPVQTQVEAALKSTAIWTDRKKASEDFVPRIYAVIHGLKEKRSALCLSGGGVRSATFNLGLLQGLARCGLLNKFDYLSTVSGGGFIGSWLTAWIYRANEARKKEGGASENLHQGLDDVIKELNKQHPPLAPEPKPLYNLRVYANYLDPKKGLMSADSWTLIAIYLRNLFLNWCVFIPAIMAFLVLPRLWVTIVKTPHLDAYTFALIGFISGVIALSYISLGLPSSKVNAVNRNDSWFVVLGLVPLVVMAMSLTAYWAHIDKEADVPTPSDFIWFGTKMAILPTIFTIIAHIRATRAERAELLKKGQAGLLVRKLGHNLVALALIGVAFGVTSYLVATIVRADAFRPPLSMTGARSLFYASLAVPAFLVILSGGGTLIAGFTSYFTDVDDQEWWARVGAWTLIVSIGWSLFHLLVLFGPLLFVEAQQLIVKQTWTWASLKGLITAVVGIGSGAISLLGGYSSKSPAHGSEEGKDAPSFLTAAVLPISAAIFFAFIILVLAQITNLLLAVGWKSLVPDLANPMQLANHTPGRAVVLMGLVLIGLGALLGRMINTNKFSLHYFWRNRMMRAYLGASRDPEEREKTRNKFTDFDNKDNLRMFQLKQKPMHMVNVTLNLAGGDKLAWQDRRAESFTMSPLHCGSYWLGYRDSKDYALNRDNEGVSLATAVAISGAAASPNMGYMMSSPIVRFIMTLFNIRLGFWLGNPGPDGAKPNRLATYNRDSPRESVRPIVEEALGMTNDRKPYVYLSDGGHFENFGLYEMILRRCRFIVISDASTDTGYDYESLAMAIRQIRVDFGVPIDMGEMQFGNQPDAKHNYCAVGVIRYSCVDRPGGSGTPAQNDEYDGVLVYLKPSLIGDEPRDVLNYHSSSPTFPQESIVDQWFSEPQFESYRALGNHMVEAIHHAPAAGKLDGFEESIKRLIKSLGASDLGQFTQQGLNHVRRHPPQDS